MNRRLLRSLALAVLAAGCAAPQRANRDANRAAYSAYLRGLMLEREADLPGALDAYRLALEYDHRSPRLYARMGATHLKLGDTDQALRAFTRALELEPRHPEALRWVAMLHASQGQLDQAIAAYEELLALQPDDQFILSTLADLYVLQGQLEQAIGLYRRMIAENGSSSQLHFNLGVLCGRLERFDEAIQELSRAFELAPDSLEVRVALGLTYELSGRYPEAAAHYEDAIRFDPLNPRLYHHAARAAFNSRQYERAVANYSAVLDLAPRDFEAVMGLVRVWLAQSKFEEAEVFLAKQLKELGQPAELYVVLGIVYREAKQHAEALRAFERSIERQADYAQGHFYLAAELDQLGKREEARRLLQRTIELDPNHSDALNYLGYLDAESGEHLQEAKAHIERALALDPENGAYLDSLGWVYYKMGRIDEAVTYLERAAAALDTDAVIFSHLGDAYFSLRDWDRARRNWERALELNPDQAEVKDKLDRLLATQETTPRP